MAVNKYHYIDLDTIQSPRVALQNINAGETGNRIWVTLSNNGEVIDMSEKSNGEFIYRVCLKIESSLGVNRQDSAVQGDGITFIEDDTGDHGKINIRLKPEVFAKGKNRCRLEIYSTQFVQYDRMICSSEFTFNAF